MRTTFLALLLIVSFVAQAQDKKDNQEVSVWDIEDQSVMIINIDNSKDFENFKDLELDKTHPNLLDPRNCSKDEMDMVYTSWKDFHSQMSKFIKENDFDWGVPDSSVTLVNKIYFYPDGTISHYSFKILNEQVDADTKAKFVQVVKAFSKEVKLDLQRDKPFAQCGKVRYKNM